ncbi:MAG: tetratricopeptide repeat protein [Humidesulfovibrio sp.]|jgi:tetratricopeptide (TPR) repeat protein|uniref:tetratricopeptide repeat protein n=1 Tax=Humidesulfovibrio sp. TaxID=2910988 RepID=UPI0027369016|nr:tetratricopeptide repeat protein [Humidesulfovibrio sp.]MDP2849186.1 tetratricopeptide repeat protein [Humidesulfovibrio sp.]
MSDQQNQEPHAAVYRPDGGKKVKGLFSTQTVEKVGTGTTQRKTISKMYWFCSQEDDAHVSVQALNKNMIPAGGATMVPIEDFLARYNPEPEMYVKTVYPKMQELASTVTRAEESRQRGALYSAQFEYENALAVDEENVRANFGLGLTYVERGETAKAQDILGRIVGLEAAFAPEHKHLFNEFGISLRKSRMVDQSVEYYTRALSLTNTDENLHYNAARAFFDKGDMEKCREHLMEAQRLNPDHEEVKKFLEFLNKQ